MIISKEAILYGALAPGLNAYEFSISIISFIPVNRLLWSPFNNEETEAERYTA